jgi:hypothetical protein
VQRIKNGDIINKHNFLVHGGSLTLFEFDGAVKDATAKELRD